MVSSRRTTLLACGVLSPGLCDGCHVGIFVVLKKSGKQRLVVDARRANLHFRT